MTWMDTAKALENAERQREIDDINSGARSQYPKGPMFPDIVIREAQYPMETMYRAIKAMEERGVDKRVIQEVYRRGWFTPEKYVTITRA